MPTPYSDYKRDGLTKLLKLGHFLCQTVSTFKAIIEAKYANEPRIIALLTAIEAVCALLPDAQTAMSEFAPDDDVPPTDTTTIAGINPDAPVSGSPIIS